MVSVFSITKSQKGCQVTGLLYTSIMAAEVKEHPESLGTCSNEAEDQKVARLSQRAISCCIARVRTDASGNVPICATKTPHRG